VNLLEELRSLFRTSQAPLRERVAAALLEHRRAQAARAWAHEALPFALDSLRQASRDGVQRVELTSAGSMAPRRLRRRIPAGALEELVALLQARGLKVQVGEHRGFFLTWEE
jgi:hypothetical protein